MIRQANEKDYKRLISSLRFVMKENDYINLDYLKQDIAANQCYILEQDNKIVAIASLVYDRKYEMYYIKRLAVPNKRNRKKGNAEIMIDYLKNQAGKVAITPWTNNKGMIKLVEKLGFEFKYTFLENYMLYVSI